MSVDVGFEARHVVTVDASVPRSDTRSIRASTGAFLVEGAQRVPSAMSAGIVSKLPMTGEGGNAVAFSGRIDAAREQRPVAMSHREPRLPRYDGHSVACRAIVCRD